jgi:predicted RNA polymerase sigma factor
MRYMLLIHGDEADDLSPGDPGFDEMMTAEIVRLYTSLADVSPTPVVALNRSVALAMADGPKAALAEMERLGLAEQLDSYQPYHAAERTFCGEPGERTRRDRSTNGRLS